MQAIVCFTAKNNPLKYLPHGKVCLLWLSLVGTLLSFRLFLVGPGLSTKSDAFDISMNDLILLIALLIQASAFFFVSAFDESSYQQM